MFYCKPCGEDQGWPTDIFVPTSRGKCEVCNGYRGFCFDVPSSHLPERNSALPSDPWAEVIPGEAAVIESIKALAAGKPNDKCSGCGTRPASESARHEPNDMDCREMQFERAWKNEERGESDDHEDLDLLA